MENDNGSNVGAQPTPVTIVEQEKPSIEDRLSAVLNEGEPNVPDGPADTGEDTDDGRASEEPEGSAERNDGSDEPDGVDGDEPSYQESADDGDENEGEVEEVEEAIQYLTELAEELESDPSELYNLKVKLTTPDGQEQEVSIGELKDFRQQAAEYVTEREQFQEAAQQFKQWAEQQSNQVFQQAQFFDAITKQALEYTNADEKAAQLDELARTDPYLATKLKEQYRQRKEEIAALRNNLADQLTQQHEQQQAQVEQYREQKLAEERAKLAEALNWKTEEQANAEGRKIAGYLQSQGFTPDVINSIVDHKAFVLIDKARRYDELQKSGEKHAKKLKRTLNGKKLSKPGSRKSKGQLAAQQQNELRSRLKKTGNVNDAAAAIAKLI